MPHNPLLVSVINRMKDQKELGDKTFAQLDEVDFYFQYNGMSNSIAVIIQHMSGNMLSRWTNFLVEDGEKSWRNRDAEFEITSPAKPELVDQWEKGWSCFLGALGNLNENDLTKTITIRSEPLNVTDAIIRQVAHYSSHVGQIIFLGKMIKGDQWKSLSIPKGKSQDFNASMNHHIPGK